MNREPNPGTGGPREQRLLPFPATLLLLGILIAGGCRSTVPLLQPPSAASPPHATVTVEGIATGGYFRLFDEGPVLDGDSVVQPRFILVPGDPTAMKELRTAAECEYVSLDPEFKRRHGPPWLGAELTLAASGTRDDYLRRLAQGILAVPESAWRTVTNEKAIWTCAFRDGAYAPVLPSDPDRVRAVGSWDHALTVRPVDETAAFALPEQARVRHERTPLDLPAGTLSTDTYRMLVALGFPGRVYWQLRYYDLLGNLEYPFVRGLPDRPLEVGRLFVDRPLDEAQRVALADAWVRQFSFLAREMSPVGLLASKPITWHRPPGKSRLVLVVSMGWERGMTVTYTRSREFEFEAGRSYRFRVLKRADGMVGHLEFESAPPEQGR